MSSTSPAQDGPTPTPARRPALVFDDPLTARSADDSDTGWGEADTGAEEDRDLARFLNEKPPHHL